MYYIRFLFQPNTIPLCAYTAFSLSVHLSVDMADFLTLSYSHYCCSEFQGSKVSGVYGSSIFNFLWRSHTALALSAAYKPPSFSTFSSIFVTSCFSDHHHPDRYKVILWFWFLVSRLLGTLNISSMPKMDLSCRGVALGRHTSTQAEPANVHGLGACRCRGKKAYVNRMRGHGRWELQDHRAKLWHYQCLH